MSYRFSEKLLLHKNFRILRISIKIALINLQNLGLKVPELKVKDCV